MNQFQEQTQTCGNCGFSEEAPETSMNDIPDPKEVKCSIDSHYYYVTDFCNKDKWKPKA